ncbi:hypothetical protein M422DRAFT_31035 [Sphaerobolus stellatus SS14]|uniref:Uncharacterized protein n=1 Tax=Sphaerobolus stellatus (strain SS14) TaxID=990650 RepID=A0A0C9UJ56_SPHS4|nr:hypothetical protein M422DRAFT_31035 [Sphaerobolus stellatus SS14]
MFAARRLAQSATRQLHTTAARSTDKAFITYTYTKYDEHHPEPRVSNNGTRTYVVSPKETSSYDVPGGAYPTSDPYVMPHPTAAPENANLSSTSPGVAHPNTTSRVPQNPSGIGSSAAVRFRSAPGEMSAGSDGGLDLMDASTTKGQNRLADRNSAPA